MIIAELKEGTTQVVEHRVKTKEVYQVQSNGTLKPFRKEDYMKLGFQNRTRLVFVTTDPTLVMLPPRVEDFGIEITLTFHNNRFWSESNTDYDFKGLSRNDTTMLKLDNVLLLIIEMAIEIFGYDFTWLPYEEMTTEHYLNYERYIKEYNDDNLMLDDKPIATSSELKKIFLAVEFLHYVDLFKNKPAYLMANKELLKNWKTYWKHTYTDSISEEQRETMKKKTNVLSTQISRIPEELFVGWGKGNTGGQLTVLAKRYLEDYLDSNYGHDKFKSRERNSWVIDTARAGK